MGFENSSFIGFHPFSRIMALQSFFTGAQSAKNTHESVNGSISFKNPDRVARDSPEGDASAGGKEARGM